MKAISGGWPCIHHPWYAKLGDMAPPVWTYRIYRTTKAVWPTASWWSWSGHTISKTRLCHVYRREANCKTLWSVSNVRKKCQTTYPYWPMGEIWYNLPTWPTILYPLCGWLLTLCDCRIPESQKSGTFTCQSISNLPQKPWESTAHHPRWPQQRVHQQRPEELVSWARDWDKSNCPIFTFSERRHRADEPHPRQTHMDYACSHNSSWVPVGGSHCACGILEKLILYNISKGINTIPEMAQDKAKCNSPPRIWSTHLGTPPRPESPTKNVA